MKMINSLDLYKCLSCGTEDLILNDQALECKACKATYSFNSSSGCYNFLTKDEHNDLFLKDINLDDLDDAVTKADNSQVRLYDEQTYVESDYAKNLVGELNLQNGALMLDHGCGRGHFSSMFSNLGYQVASADILEYALSSLDSDKKAVCNLAKLPYKDNTFDGVLSLDVFEHLRPSTMNSVINEIFRVLKPGGVFLISFPGNRIPDLIGIHFINIFILFMRLLGSNYPFMRSNKIKAHINLNSPWHFKRALRKAGFSGVISPYNNKFMTLPKKFRFLAKLLNFPLIAPIFIHQMHGVLTKPKPNNLGK
jgi:SAM-dependent methyltransferase